MRSMRLLILATYYLPDINAQSIRISQIARRFYQNDADMSIRIAVFDPKYECSSGSCESVGPEDIRRYNRKILPSFFFLPQSLNPLTLLSWLYISMKEICKFDPDFVLATTPPFTPTIALYLASKAFRKKFTYIVDYRDDLGSVIESVADTKSQFVKHSLKAVNRFMSCLLSHSVRSATLVSTVNEALQKKLQKENERVLLVPNGLDLAELADLGQSFNREEVLNRNGIFNLNSKVVVFLGDLEMSYYLPEAILKPLKQLKDRGSQIIYIIIGNGSRRGEIEAQIKDLGLEDFVYLVGQKDHRDAMELLMTSDLAFYPLQKGYPQAEHVIAAKVYEYIGCKLPILALADEDSAIFKCVRRYGIGISLSWDEPDRLEDALESMLETAEYKDNLMRHYDKFLERFDRNRGIDLLYRSIRDALDSRP